ncbi:serine protease [Aquimarina sp. 2201CG5-10]|uniref:trypsin-like serine peptidase n=1 Tax=Aquimarina callyspongiae TaxID=3098150 RepID=UPI002AB4CA30|nr:serine protease [Aquimarina sp. 2201CG5-10]MDY8134684.1 serine protease [Aquimarina sp. 2201CG5-10]
MDTQKQTSENKNSRQSPKDVLANLKAYYNNEEIMRSIELRVDFTNGNTFFKSLETFLNDFEDAYVIDMLFHSTINGINEDMDLYKRAEQSIIKTIDRPVFLINNDEIDIAITTPWKRHINDNTDTISKVIPAVGRIEITGDDRRNWIGTGWLLKNTCIVVTNKHVANKFASSNEDGTYKIREDWMGDPYRIRIDFKKEHATNEELEFDVKQVVYIPKGRELDIALLLIDDKNHRGNQLPEGLELSYKIPSFKEKIYVVGYPACFEDEVKRDEHFNSLAGVKQFAPGKFSKTRVHRYVYFHDCTTWNGNSGSPLLDFDSGKVIGIHFAGDTENVKGFRTNYAVSGLILKDILEELDIFYNH